MKGKETKKEAKKEKKEATGNKVQSDYQKEKSNRSAPIPIINKHPAK